MLIMGPDGDLENTGKIQLISVFCSCVCYSLSDASEMYFVCF